jgi:hypothetical protein
MPRETATTEAESRVSFRGCAASSSMHMAATEVKKLSKFGTEGRTKRMFDNESSNKPQSQKWYKRAPRRADTMQPRRDRPRSRPPLKAGGDELLGLRHVVGDIVRCDLVTGGKPNSVVAGDVIHCFLKIFVPERNIDDERVQAQRHDTA